jgi:two-component system capsular synthesis sensor histidine kinase RcsC
MAGSPSTLNILLIEDDALVREIVTEMLASLGHSVLATAGGREGLARLEAGDSVDLVLTDLNMPEMSGWEVVKAVKAHWPTLRVGLITGTPDLLREQREPVDLVIEKPVSLKALREAISRVCP